MSSDESTSTQISTVSNRDGTKDKLKTHKSEKWEINFIGNFVLGLYHRLLIGFHNEWCINKTDIRKEFSNFKTEDISKKFKELNGTDNIGTLLHRCGFILNSPRGSNFFKIKYSSLFEFRNNRLKELDNLKLNIDAVKQGSNDNNEPESKLLDLLENDLNLLVEETFEINEDEPKLSLQYQGTTMQRRLNGYLPTNMSCCICQEDFSGMETYEEHIQKHGDDSDFEFLTSMEKFENPFFEINYTTCKNSHYFCFEFETDIENLIIEKIIVVQSRSFYYVHNRRVPYSPKNGKDRFFVDSHLFTIHVEQPIILICHRENCKESRIIEQHHFMRSLEFPKVNFAINPYRLPNKKTFKPKFTLADYFPPKEVQDSLKDDFYYEKLMKTSNEFRDYVRNGKKLQPQTLGASMNILLQIEDMDTITQYIQLTQNNVKLRSYGDEYSLQLKPKQRIFIENILSAYDELILTTRTDIFRNKEEILKLMLQNKSDIERMKNTFVGIIQAVNTGRISFKCYQKINLKVSYTVICRPSRINFRYQYRSLELLPEAMNFLTKFLFPTKIIPKPLSTNGLSLYNKNVNGEQLQAVRNIAEGPRNDATYVIFGPPGTGKTTTLVEGILQLLKKPETKILVTASSNSACDEIAKRLCKYLDILDIRRCMVRIYSRSSEIRTETIDDELLENSNMYNGQFYPDIEILHEYRVVVCTLSVVAKLATGKFGRETLYTHLFIDEVAASTEAEALMGITAILTSRSCLIISGDHKQLGPILQSKRAQELGLGASLMDRLLERDCYRVDIDTGDYDRTIQTRLIRNYRSHPAIVNLYSGLYYNHSLEAHAKKDDVSLCEIWHKSRNKQYPIIFHAIHGPSRSDSQSHSLFNLHELQVVMQYVKDLMYFGINEKPVAESDIGIISPYKKQFKRIQEELNLRKWFGIETGSVETFQGKEKDIIIVSFVRSRTPNLGFLENPRRLNVTLSRPKSLLILIGNPETLSLNSDFEYIIKECQRNKTYVGANWPKKDDDNTNKQDFVTLMNKNLQALTLESTNKNINDKSSKSDNQDEKSKIINKTRRSRNSNRRKKNSNNPNIKSNEENTENQYKRDADNEKNEDNDDDNDNEDDDDDDTNEEDNDSINVENDMPSTSASKNNRERSRRGKNKGQIIKRTNANGGKISKRNVIGKPRNISENNKKLGENKIDSIFNELPKVPAANVPRVSTYTSEQVAQLQQQQRTYFDLLQRNGNLQQQEQQNYNLPQQLQNYNLPHQPQNYNLQPQQLPNFNQPFSTSTFPAYQSFIPQQRPPLNPQATYNNMNNANLYSMQNFAGYNNNTNTANTNTNNMNTSNVSESKDNKRNTKGVTSKPDRRNQNRMGANNFKSTNKSNTPFAANKRNADQKRPNVAANIHKFGTNNNSKASNSSQPNKNNSYTNAPEKRKQFDKSQSDLKSVTTSNPVVAKPTTVNKFRENKNIGQFTSTSTGKVTKHATAASLANNIKPFTATTSSRMTEKPSSISNIKPTVADSVQTNKNNGPPISRTSAPGLNRNITGNSDSNMKPLFTTNSFTESGIKTVNRNLDKPTTTTNIYPTIRSVTSETSTSSSKFSANSHAVPPNTSIDTRYFNPPTNPYVNTATSNSYEPSAPWASTAQVANKPSSYSRSVRTLSFDEKREKKSGNGGKDNSCVIA